jgi:putative transcriptional regulator
VKRRKQGKPKARRRLSGPIHGRILELREAKELTQEQLAKAVGVTKSAVSHWEKGIAPPALHRLPALAEALGGDVDEFVSMLMESAA